MSYDCCCTRKMNREDHREVLATAKLRLNLLSLLIRLIKIMSFYAIYAYFILHFLFILLMVLFSKRWVFRGASCGGTARSGDSMKWSLSLSYVLKTSPMLW